MCVTNSTNPRESSTQASGWEHHVSRNGQRSSSSLYAIFLYFGMVQVNKHLSTHHFSFVLARSRIEYCWMSHGWFLWPFVRWTVGHWQYEHTLYSHDRSWKRSRVSIYLVCFMNEIANPTQVMWLKLLHLVLSPICERIFCTKFMIEIAKLLPKRDEITTLWMNIYIYEWTLCTW